MVRAVAAWRDGLPLDQYVSSFPFMKPGELAQAFAEGRIAEARWDALLASEHPSSCRPLLLRLAAHEELRRLFPSISYGDLSFAFPPPRPDARVFSIREDGDGYRVRESGTEAREYVLGGGQDSGGDQEIVRRITGFFS
ncbi:hypothetical protein GXW82_10710 [Streptacidiphilus sp. 4-A2]|nr:hypothetical protein [Streptacidiphilus sp. 4-A2]